MTRTQWLTMAAIGVVACMAYTKSERIARYIGLTDDTAAPGPRRIVI